MHKLFLLLFLFVLGINGKIYWQSRQTTNCTASISHQLTCSIKPVKPVSNTLVLPGPMVLLN